MLAVIAAPEDGHDKALRQVAALRSVRPPYDTARATLRLAGILRLPVDI